MPTKKAVRDLGGSEVLLSLPDELRLTYKCGSETLERTLYAAPAYISREKCFTLAMVLPEVSQFHARVEWDDKTRKWKIKDMKSTGGTKVNGRKVRSDRCTGLKDGDVIKISGTVHVKVEVVPVKEGTGRERIQAFVRTRQCEYRWLGEEKIKHVKTTLEGVRNRAHGILDAHED